MMIFIKGEEQNIHGIWHFSLYSVRGERGFGIGIVDLVAIGGKQAAGVAVGEQREDVVGWDGEERVIEGRGRHCVFVYLNWICKRAIEFRI